MACPDAEKFTNLRWLPKPQTLSAAGKTKHSVLAKGEISFLTRDTDGKLQMLRFTDVNYCPDLDQTYISEDKALSKGWSTAGNKRGVTWTDPQAHTFRLAKRNGQGLLWGNFLSRAEATSRVSGFTSRDFTTKITEMTTKQLTKLVEDDPQLSRWELWSAQMMLAKRGTLTYKDNKSRLLALHHQPGHISWRRTAAFARKHGIPLTDIEQAFCASCLAKNQKRKGKKSMSPTHIRHNDQRAGKRAPKAVRFKNPQNTEAERARAAARDALPANSKFSVDVWGPVNPATHGKHTQILIIVENKGGRSWSYPLRNQLGIPQRIDTWLRSMKEEFKKGGITNIGCELGAGITIRSDSAAVFKSAAMDTILAKHEANISFSPPHCQQKNHVAEKCLGTIAAMAKAMLHCAGLPSGLWNYAWVHAEKLYNALPRRANTGEKSPHEVSTGKPPIDPTKKYHGFGQEMHVWVPKTERTDKLGDRSRKGTYLGHDEKTDCPVVQVRTKTGRTVVRVTDEYRLNPNLPAGVYDGDTCPVPDEEEWDWDLKPHKLVGKGEPQGGLSDDRDDAPITDKAQADAPAEVIPPPQPNYPSPDVFDNMTLVGHDETQYHVSAVLAPHNKPAYSLATAKKRWPARAQEIEEAAQLERDGLTSRCMEEMPLEEITAHDRAAASTLLTIYTEKMNGHMHDKMKMRACFRGEMEVEGTDWINSSSNLPRLSSLRMLLALSPVSKDAQDWAGDISMAFTRAPLEPIPANMRRLVQFPGDVSRRDHRGRRIVYKLTHSLYGQHAAASEWQKMLWGYLRHLGLEQSDADPAIWVRRTNGAVTMTLAIWTDDLVWRGTKADCIWFRGKMEEKWGDIRATPLQERTLLGLHVTKSADGFLGIHSSSYITKLIEREKLTGDKPKATPLPPTLSITKDDRAEGDDVDPQVTKQYQVLLGSLSYLACWVRFDLSYPASCLAAVASAPKKSHLKLVRRALAYLKNAPGLGLQYKKPKNPAHLDTLRVWSDASFAQETKNCSQSGFVAMMNDAPVHWFSSRQEFPALSSTEAEIMAGSTALRYTIHLRRLLLSLGHPQGAIEFHLDAENAIRYFQSEKISKRNHHIGTRYERFRHHVTIGDVEIVFCKTENMLADIPTKNATELQFNTVVHGIMTNLGTPSD